MSNERLFTDGGPAFPDVWYTDDGTQFGDRGMSLRDYFAAAALPALLIPESAKAALAEKTPEMFFAKAAYELADAMLAERIKAAA